MTATTTSHPDPGQRRFVRRAQLAVHVLALALVLGVGMLVVDPTVSYSADEGAVIAQVEVLADEGTWIRPHPLPEVDPTGEWFPLEFPVVVEDGAASYVKHPSYPITMLPFRDVAGTTGMVVASVLGTIVTAVGAAVLARSMRPAAEVPTLWLIGVGSPLLFDAYLVIAHSLAAAAVVWGVIAALRAVESSRPLMPTLLAAGALGLATLWRTEAIFLGPALAVAVVLGRGDVAVARRVVVGAAAAVGSVGAYVLDGRLSQWVLGADGVEVFVIRSQGNLLTSRVNGLVNTWLRPVSGEIGIGSALLLAVPVVLLVLALLSRAAAPDPGRIRILAGAAAVLAVGGAASAPTSVVPGLLVAFPLLVLVFASWRSLVADPAQRVLLATAALYALGVLATQYERGGTAEWGGRYFALGLALVAPSIVIAAQDLVRRTAPEGRRLVAGALLVVPLALGFVAVSSLQAAHERTDAVVSGVVDAAAVLSDDDRPVLVSVAALVPRLAWDHLDDARWLFVPPDDLDQFFDEAADVGVNEVLVVTPGELGAYTTSTGAFDADRAEVVWGNWTVTRLRPDP
ncbi:hypothetical protein [Actinomarinicola tropica]|uniref:Glycosyltransferase RgtA/B/C/D-like domain-containing protein n=1 Tax=Actinomarinicola tropica TaxID=2789776 RepID=A0A5Q2RLL3_9ACTN|nr:hypothetical protein [Actinomarinicola tropica]QGG95471.1 hypothetical protein GH723_10375 [Actinomarinicola tropica]